MVTFLDVFNTIIQLAHNVSGVYAGLGR